MTTANCAVEIFLFHAQKSARVCVLVASIKKPKTKQPRPKADVSNNNANDTEHHMQMAMFHWLEPTETTMQDLIQSCLPVSIHRRGYLNARNNPSSCELASPHTHGRDVVLLDFAGCRPKNTAIAETKHVLHYEGTHAMADADLRTGLLCTKVITSSWMPLRRSDPRLVRKTSFMPRTMAAMTWRRRSKQTNGSDWTIDAETLVKDKVTAPLFLH